MIEFSKKTLDNGLVVIVHKDNTTPLVALNVAYNVGSRDENPEKTGFAHLFEHLMFGGSTNIPDYDTPLQKVGGDSNAFTTNDITNYYLTLPAANVETGFWLESDRMLELDFNEHSLSVQKNVVIEEFKQRYLNQPYGDVCLLLKKMAYQVHPYQWATIGKEISHIEQASLNDVKDFFYSHYAPNNAVLVIAGNIEVEEAFNLAEKWFGPIPRRNVSKRDLPQEPEQTVFRSETVKRNVQFDAIYMAFHMDKRLSQGYYAADLISDILSSGNSSRMYRHLVVEKQLFGELDAYISGDNDPGLFLISGKLISGITMEDAEKAIWDELETIKNEWIEEEELQKVINKVEANMVFSEISYLNKAMNLAALELLDDAELINKQISHYRAISEEEINKTANALFQKDNCSTLYYLKK